MSAIDFAAAAPARLAIPAAAVRVRPYASPYLAGVGIGLVLLLAYATVGRGLGASGAFSAAAAAGVAAVAPEQAAASPVLGEYVGGGARGPLADWLVIELIGVALGGYLSARLAGRRRRTVERGPRITDRARLMYGFGGGVVMGVGAKLARGCTSGQALTGGALLSVGSWIFIATAFAAAFAAAPLFRREWT
ncbi:MAG TPA: YeeE/YedE thiosulfate transporter family protein [Longimicrobium sp.]